MVRTCSIINHTVGVVIYAGQKFMQFSKITHHKIYAGDIYAIATDKFNYWGVSHLCAKQFIFDFNYANFLSVAKFA